jgi:hypothetical protein
VLSIIALFVALGGVSYGLAGKNTVASDDIINGAVKSKDIKNSGVKSKDLNTGSVKSSDVQDDSLQGGDINENTLGKVPSANQADQATDATNATNAATASRLGTIITRKASVNVVDGVGGAAAVATCLAGEQLIGGGARFVNSGGATDLQLISSGPQNAGAAPDEGGPFDSWRAAGVNQTGGTGDFPLTAFAICLQ